jgi:hypothetical protein
MIRKEILLAVLDYETTGISDSDLPIEVGIRFVDYRFNLLSSFQGFINWPQFGPHDEWPKQWAEAFKYHKIPLRTIKQGGHNPMDMVDLIQTVTEATMTRIDATRCVMVSDNAIFEHKMTKKLFSVCPDTMPFSSKSRPFHYKIFDPSMMYDMFGMVIESSTGIKEHRSLSDCDLMIKTLKKIQSRIDKEPYDEGKEFRLLS